MSAKDQAEQVRQSAERLTLERRTSYPDLDAIEHMMTETAQKAVEGTLQRLGIDTSNPISAQQDFARLRVVRKLMEDENFQLDLAFIRRWRLKTETISDTSIKTTVRWVVVGLLGILTLITKDWWITHIKG